MGGAANSSAWPHGDTNREVKPREANSISSSAPCITAIAGDQQQRQGDDVVSEREDGRGLAHELGGAGSLAHARSLVVALGLKRRHRPAAAASYTTHACTHTHAHARAQTRTSTQHTHCPRARERWTRQLLLQRACGSTRDGISQHGRLRVVCARVGHCRCGGRTS